MLNNGEKLGAFIVPTGVGATIGGFAGDASCYARKFAEISNIIVNPNVVNAGCFSGITENMLYVEGFSIDEFFIIFRESASRRICRSPMVSSSIKIRFLCCTFLLFIVANIISL